MSSGTEKEKARQVSDMPGLTRRSSVGAIVLLGNFHQAQFQIPRQTGSIDAVGTGASSDNNIYEREVWQDSSPHDLANPSPQTIALYSLTAVERDHHRHPWVADLVRAPCHFECGEPLAIS